MNQSGKQSLFLDMESVFSFRPTVYTGNGTLEGSFIDDRTFAGIWRMNLQEVLTDSTTIDEMAREAESEGREFLITEENEEETGLQSVIVTPLKSGSICFPEKTAERIISPSFWMPTENILKNLLPLNSQNALPVLLIARWLTRMRQTITPE